MPLGEGIRRLIASLGLETRLLEQRVLRLWADVATELTGQAVAQETRPETIRRGELLISVRQDALRHRLFFDRERIRKQLNRAVGREVVQSIRFVK